MENLLDNYRKQRLANITRGFTNLPQPETEISKAVSEDEDTDDDDLVKGGEGSKGGKIIGHTKAGHPVYASMSKKAWQKHNFHDEDEGYDNYTDAVHDHLKSKAGDDEDMEKEIEAHIDGGYADKQHPKHIAARIDGIHAKKKVVTENNLEKGEGDKGGNIIGHTKSGKPIYGNHPAGHYKDFTEQDHRDAQEKHEGMINFHTEIGLKSKDDDEKEKHEKAGDKHMTHASNHERLADRMKDAK